MLLLIYISIRFIQLNPIQFIENMQINCCLYKIIQSPSTALRHEVVYSTSSFAPGNYFSNDYTIDPTSSTNPNYFA